METWYRFRVCPNCAQRAVTQVLQCRKCGFRYPPPDHPHKECPVCHRSLAPNASSCAVCGHWFQKDVQEAA